MPGRLVKLHLPAHAGVPKWQVQRHDRMRLLGHTYLAGVIGEHSSRPFTACVYLVRGLVYGVWGAAEAGTDDMTPPNIPTMSQCLTSGKGMEMIHGAALPANSNSRNKARLFNSRDTHRTCAAGVQQLNWSRATCPTDNDHQLSILDTGLPGLQPRNVHVHRYSQALELSSTVADDVGKPRRAVFRP